MPEKFVTKRGLKGDKRGVTAPMGVILMLGITLTSALTAGQAFTYWMDATTDHANAEAERSRFYAECARAVMDESIEPHPACFDDDWYKRVPGYHCWEDKTRVVCEKAETTISSED